MRWKPWAASALATVLVLGACGSDDASDPTTTAPAATTTTAAGTTAVEAAADEAYPVTVSHEFGETTIEQRPERIVVVGLTEQDALLALGVAPVAVTDWFGGYDYAAFPWAQAHLGDATPEVLDDTEGIQFERVVELQPDLIVGLYAGLTQEDYDTLSAIAPTVAQPSEYVDWGIPWQEQTLTLGRIVGKADEAAALVADVEARIEAAKAEHPEFVGTTAVMATPYEGVWVYTPEDVRGRLLASLGFVMPDDLVALATDDFGFQLSLERLDLLDVDTIVWLDPEDTGEAFTTNALYNSLTVHTEGREILLDSEGADGLGAATSFVTVLSVPFLLDGLVPKLAAALDGDPATATG